MPQCNSELKTLMLQHIIESSKGYQRLLQLGLREKMIIGLMQRPEHDFWASAWFNLGVAGITGAWFLPVGPVWPMHALHGPECRGSAAMHDCTHLITTVTSS